MTTTITDRASPLTEMEAANSAMKEESARTSIAEYFFIAATPIGIVVGFAIGEVIDDPSLLVTLPWSPYYWAVFAAGATALAGFFVGGRRESRSRALKERVAHLAPSVVQGISDGSIKHLSESQGTLLASVAGERTLREALQSSPSFRQPAQDDRHALTEGPRCP